ncbi:MAG TPA: hypothetical protein VLA36_01495, partial [Longimicrobiales bacterium]|nr:hypothetical protein [Longimicrobiales bacterium]
PQGSSRPVPEARLARRSAHGRTYPKDPTEEFLMKSILNLMGMTIGGWIGWAMGAQVSVFTAYMVSIVGTGLGLYAAIRTTKHLLP